MSKTFSMVPLGNLLIPISRPEAVDPDRTYRILGAHSYAEGLYIKEIKLGSEIQAEKVYRIEQGDFVYNRLFAWKGSFAVATSKEHNCYVSNEFPAFAVDHGKLSAQYLQRYFCCAPVWNEALSLSTGSTPASRNRLKEDKLLAMEIPLPPLEEQQRIIARIEELAAKVEEARGLRREVVEETQALLEVALKEARKLLLKSSYPKDNIGNITSVISGGTPSRSTSTYWHGDIPWVKTGELVDDDIYQTEEHISLEGLNNSSAKLFPPSTVLIALYGQGQTRGRTGRLMIEAATNQACCAILPNPSLLEAQFTQYWLRSLYTQMRDDSHGGAQPNWNSQTIKNIEIALPPLAEQQSIVAHFDNLQSKVNTLKRKQAETSAELDALLPSILDKAFKGEL